MQQMTADFENTAIQSIHVHLNACIFSTINILSFEKKIKTQQLQVVL